MAILFSCGAKPGPVLTNHLLAYAGSTHFVRNPVLVFDYLYLNADGSAPDHFQKFWQIRDDSLSADPHELECLQSILEGIAVGYALAMRTAS